MSISNSLSARSVFDYFRSACNDNPKKIYLALHGDRNFRYDQCYTLVNKLAIFIDRQPRQDKLMILSNKDPFVFVISFWACMLCGAGVLLCSDIQAIDDAYKRDNMDLDFSGTIQKILSDKGDDDFFIGEQRFFQDAKIYFLTSGTTGTPKLILNTGEQLIVALDHVRGYEKMDYLRNGDTCFITPPLHHSYGLSSLLEYTAHAFTIILPKDQSILSCIGPLLDKGAADKVGSIEGVPFFYEQLSKFFNRAGLTRLKHIGFGADHVSKDLIGIYRSNYPQVNFTVRYGLTEIPSVISVQSFHAIDEYAPDGIQDWLPCYQLYLKDEEMTGQGLQGELCINYYNTPGWSEIRTGDLAGWQDNKFILKGRKAAVFKHMGMKVNPIDIEQVIERHPTVLGALVYLDDKAVLKADIVVEQGFERTALLNLLTAQLPGYMLPGKINIVDHLPRTQTGKLVRSRDPSPPRTVNDQVILPRHGREGESSQPIPDQFV